MVLKWRFDGITAEDCEHGVHPCIGDDNSLELESAICEQERHKPQGNKMVHVQHDKNCLNKRGELLGSVQRCLQILLCSFAIAISDAHAERLSVVFDDQTFTQRYEAVNPNGDKLIEFLLDGESLEKWTKLVAYRYQPLPRIQNDPKKAALALMQAVRLNNPKAPAQAIAKNDGEEAIVDFLTWPASGEFLEFNIFKYAKSQDGRAVVSFQWAFRFSSSDVPPEKYRELRAGWIKAAASFDMDQVRKALDNASAATEDESNP